jgi:hypothetical protein
MNRVAKILIVSVLMLAIVGCSSDRTREQKVSAMIGEIEKPYIVANLSLQNLMDKSAVMEEGTLPFTYYQVISFFLDKKLTGIDYNTKIQAVVGQGESFIPNFYGIFKIEDEKLFTELVEVEANAEVKEKEGMKYVVKEKEMYCIVWKEDIAIISNIPMDLMSMLMGGGDGQGEKMVDKNIAIIKSAEEGEVNEDWVTFLNKDSDIAIHYDGEAGYSYALDMAVDNREEVEEMRDVIEGISLDMYIDFNKGSMDITYESELSEDLLAELSFIGKDGVNKALFRYGKTEKPMMSGAYKVEVNGMTDYFQANSEEGYDEMVENVEKAGFVFDDIKGAISGEFVYMVDGIERQEKVIDFGYGESFTHTETVGLFGIVVGLSDKSIVEKMMEDMMMASLELADTDYSDEQGVRPELNMLPNGVVQIDDAYIYLGDRALFASNDSAWANKVAGGNGVTIDNPEGILNSNPFAMLAKFEGLSEMEGMDDEAKAYADIFKRFTLSMNIESGKMALSLKDNSENSLKIIMAAVGSALADFEKMSNPEMEAELEEALNETLEKLEDEIEEGVDEALDKLDE